MELVEFITVNESPGKYSKQPKEIHIYYKLIDKSANDENAANLLGDILHVQKAKLNMKKL